MHAIECVLEDLERAGVPVHSDAVYVVGGARVGKDHVGPFLESVPILIVDQQLGVEALPFPQSRPQVQLHEVVLGLG